MFRPVYGKELGVLICRVNLVSKIYHIYLKVPMKKEIMSQSGFN